MSRKDYKLIAAVLAGLKPRATPVTPILWERIVEAMSVALRAENPRFDRDRFLAACGYNQKEGA